MTLPGIHATFRQHRPNSSVVVVKSSWGKAAICRQAMVCVALLFVPGMIAGCGSNEQAGTVEQAGTLEEAGTAPDSAESGTSSEGGTTSVDGSTAAGNAELAAPADNGADNATADGIDVAMEPDVADVPDPDHELVGPDLADGSAANSTAAKSDDPGAMLSPAQPDAEKDSADILPFNPYAEKSEFELRAEQAFADPDGARLLVEDKRIWVDAKKKRVVVDGYVAISEGPLEMFACPVGTKEHESVVALMADAQHVHTGLLAVGAVQGTPVEFVPQYRPATGQRIAIWVLWNDAEGKLQRKRAQEWVQQTGTDKQLEQDWVFAGSGFWTDPESGRKFYEADSGDLVCVSNFSTATLDLPVESSQSNAALMYSAFRGRVPEIGTPVRLVFMPIPVPGESLADGQADPAAAPDEALLTPGKPSASK